MARNIEIKARLDNRAAVEKRLAEMSVEHMETIQQHDIFYHSSNGRLKLRSFADQSAELIFYQRDDAEAAKESFYLRTPIPDPKTLNESLARAYGVRGEVKKQRHLYLIGRTRVHLDLVQDLGEYLELEVVLSENETNTDGVREANEILDQLGVPRTATVAGAYIDLLVSTGDSRSTTR